MKVEKFLVRDIYERNDIVASTPLITVVDHKNIGHTIPANAEIKIGSVLTLGLGEQYVQLLQIENKK